MIYFFNKNSLTFKPIVNIASVISFTLTILSFIVLLIANKFTNKITDNIYPSTEKPLLVNQSDTFTVDKLKNYITQLQIKFPQIVYAQSVLETGYFKSNIYLCNNNLFGMKVATQRITTNTGEEFGHATYKNWRESVLDYAFFQSTYLFNIKNEHDYLEYLKANYASNHNYIIELKKIINQN